MQQQWQLICKHLRLKSLLFDWRALAISQIDVVSDKIQLQLDLRVAQPWNM
jgi:hypothetical protein